MHRSLPAKGSGRLPRLPAAEEFLALVERLRRQLALFVAAMHDRAGGADLAVEELHRLRGYLVGEFNLVLYALALRVRPPLRGLGTAGPDVSSASEHARLLRLTEWATVICDDGARPGHGHAHRPDRLVGGRHAATSGRDPARAARLPAASRRGRIDSAAQRTVRAAGHASRLELGTALL